MSFFQRNRCWHSFALFSSLDANVAGFSKLFLSSLSLNSSLLGWRSPSITAGIWIPVKPRYHQWVLGAGASEGRVSVTLWDVSFHQASLSLWPCHLGKQMILMRDGSLSPGTERAHTAAIVLHCPGWPLEVADAAHYANTHTKKKCGVTGNGPNLVQH